MSATLTVPLGSVFVSTASGPGHRALLAELAAHGQAASVWHGGLVRSSAEQQRVPIGWAAQVLPSATGVSVRRADLLGKALGAHVRLRLSLAKEPVRVHFVNARTALRSGPFVASVLKASHVPLTLHGRWRPDEALLQIAHADALHAVVSLTTPHCVSRPVMSLHPGGQVGLARGDERHDELSSASAKLLHAELHLGRRIVAGERVLDLGCSPGSWSAVAVARGAVVDGVDRGVPELVHERFVFHRADARTFAAPPDTFDWLLCDMVDDVAGIHALAERWLSPASPLGNTDRPLHFVITVKHRDPVAEASQAVALARAAAQWCGNGRGVVGMRHLAAANTSNELTLFGIVFPKLKER